MTITIPTCELVGLLGDALPFAHPDKELQALNSVRVWWDGDMLHTFANNGIAAAWSSWHPDDDPDPGQDIQGDLFADWGGDDHPWAVTLPAADVKDLITMYKLPKFGFTPLTVEFQPFPNRLRVSRSGDTGHPAKTCAPVGRKDELQDPTDAFARAAEIAAKVDQIAYSACQLALYAKPRQRGPMRLEFGPKATHVTIGHRFRGMVLPEREAAA